METKHPCCDKAPANTVPEGRTADSGRVLVVSAESPGRLKHFGLLDKLRAGRVSNAHEILAATLGAPTLHWA